MTLVQRLREAGGTGLDLSPGDPLCIEAADEIDRLSDPGGEPVEWRIEWQDSDGDWNRSHNITDPESAEAYQGWESGNHKILHRAIPLYARPSDDAREAVQKVATDAANYLSRVAGNDGEAAEILLDIQEFILAASQAPDPATQFWGRCPEVDPK